MPRGAPRPVRRVCPGASRANDAQPPGAAAIERALGAADDRLGAERHGDVERAADFDAVEIRRRDADDGERVAVEVDCAPEDLRYRRRTRAARSRSSGRRPGRPARRSRRSSSAVKGRPTYGVTPSTSKKRPLTKMPATGRASPPALRLNRAPPWREHAAEEVLMIAEVFPLRVGERGARLAVPVRWAAERGATSRSGS